MEKQNIKTTIGARIKSEREEHNQTQTDLAKVLDLHYDNGYDRKRISLIENGHALPTIEQIIKISELYSVSIDYLLCRPGVNLQHPENTDAHDRTGLSEHALNLLSEYKSGACNTAEELSYFIDNRFLNLLENIDIVTDSYIAQSQKETAYKKAQSVIDFKLTGETLVNKLADIDDSVLENLITDNLNYCFDVISASEIDKLFSAPEDAQTDPALYIETRGYYISDKIYLLRNGIPVYPGICRMVLPKDISPGRFKLIRAVYSALVYTKDLLAKYEEKISAQRYMISKTFDNLIDKYIEHTIKNG